ncbi:MAG: serine/threonine-protein kinase [Gemmataceae bacterium]
MTDLNALESLYFAALGKPPAERPAFLDAACGNDAGLRARVERLLSAQADIGGFLDAPAATADVPSTGRTATFGDSSATADYPGRDEQLGTVLGGKYKLVEAIGEGGMGSVFMAQQTEPVKRAVAVKVIKAGMDSKAVLARFEAERQALAMMDHPNIARVLDAGTTEGGRPYFVMELVKGVPITQFCDERKLTPRERLELFVPVCQAIQHAHQKGVIHRDIKPSNVLVALYDDRPVPKVIDFGVAKAAGSTLTDKTLMTGFGAVVGTPEYMSPEQASLNNLDIDTRSDVYSLGVLLYELLTGTTPVDRKSLGQAALLEILRVVREVEAPRPSAKLSTIDTLPSIAANRGTEPAKLSKLMRGELDWVVLKALEKDRSRRYDTANALSRDIQRYLADELIEARPPSTGYRMKKFVRRHKGQVLAVCLVLFALLGGIAGTTLGLIRAEHARENEEAERQKAQDERDEKATALAAESKARATTRKALDVMTSRIMDDYLSRQGPLPESGKTMLTDALRMYEVFAEERSGDLTTQESVVRAQHRVASILAQLGREEEAMTAFDRALTGWTRLNAAMSANPEWRTEAVRAEFERLKLKSLPTVYKPLPELESELLRSTDRLVQDFPSCDSARDLELEVLTQLAVRAGESLRYRECFTYLSRGLAVADHLLAKRPNDPEIELRRVTLQQKEIVYRNRTKDAAGDLNVREHGELITAYENIAKSRPGSLEALAGAARSRLNQGLYFGKVGEHDQSEAEFRHAEAAIARLISEFPGVIDHRIMLGELYNHWGHLLRRQKSPEARIIADRAYATWKRLADRNPGNHSVLGGLGGAELLLVHIDLDAGDFSAVKSRTDRLLSIYDVVEDPNPASFSALHGGIHVHSMRARMFVWLWRFEEAAAEWRKCSYCERKLNPKDLRYLIASWVCMARAGKSREALEEFRQCVPGGVQNRDVTASNCCNIAMLLALASERMPQEQAKLASESIEFITRAWRDGYRNCAEFGGDMGLNPIRSRPEFQQIMTEVNKQWAEEIAKSPPSEKPRIRASRAYAWALEGKSREAVAEVVELTKSDKWDLGAWYDFACVYALASGRASDMREAYGYRSVELLRQAINSGWKNLVHIKNDSDLDPLRDREDFRALVADLERRFPPLREVAPPPREVTP